MTTTAVEKATHQWVERVDQEAVLKALNLNPRDPKTQALLLVCDRYGLDPLLKHIVLIQGNAYVTRDGYLAVAHRSGQFDGMEVVEQGETKEHHTAKVSVFRKDMGRPFTFIGRFPKAKQMAKEYGPEMAVKVAEVQALRRAFNVTGVGAADERWDDDASERVVAEEAPATPRPADVDDNAEQVQAPSKPRSTRRPPPGQKDEAKEPFPDAPADGVVLASDAEREAIYARLNALPKDGDWRETVTRLWKERLIQPVKSPIHFATEDAEKARALLDEVEAAIEAEEGDGETEPALDESPFK